MRKIYLIVSFLILSGLPSWAGDPDNIQKGKGITSFPKNSNHQITIHESVRKNGTYGTTRSTVINKDNRYEFNPRQKDYFNRNLNERTRPKTRIVKEKGRK